VGAGAADADATLVGATTSGADATVVDTTARAPSAAADTAVAAAPVAGAAGSTSGEVGPHGGPAAGRGPDGTHPGGRLRGRRRWRRALLLVPIVLAALGAAGWFGYQAYLDAQPASAAVPRVATLERAAAEAELAAAERSVEGGLDWEVVVEEEHNEVVLAGFVIDQDPQTGTELDDGGTVRLLVSLGPPPRPVPDLFNRTEEEVRTDLGRGELTLGDVQEQHVEDVEAGRVITWSVAGQDRPAEAPKGSEVDLVVSSGPAPRTVPPLEGVTLDAARAALDELGLVIQVSEAFSTVAEGAVISSSPDEGATLARGGTVAVVVSKGRDLVVVPDVAGSSIDGAIASLRARGLVEGDVSGPAGGDVNATDPEAGASVERGTVVDLFLRR
jgi:serine/threonine-protein kinase